VGALARQGVLAGVERRRDREFRPRTQGKMNISGSGGQGVYRTSDASGPGGRQSSGRVLELIDQLRGEFELVSQEIKAYRGLREEFQRKVEEHVNEISNLEQALVQMEQKSQHYKEQYDAEMMRLKKQLMSGTPLPPASGGIPRDEPITSLPGLGSRDRIPPTNSSQLGAGFPGSQTASAPNSKRPRTDVKPTTTATGTTIMGTPIGNPVSNPLGHPPGGGLSGLPLGSNGLNPDTAKSGTSAKEETNEAQPGTGVSASGGMIGIQDVSQTNNSVNQETDYIVYQGRTSAGTLLNMNVRLQNSFAHDSVVCCVRYSWSGQYLATGSNKCAQIFDAATGSKIATFARDDNGEPDEGSHADSYIRAVCFSPDGKWLITGSEDRLVKVWDVRARTVKHRLAGHETDIYSVDASGDGKFIASGSGDKKAKLWDLNTGRLLHTLSRDCRKTDSLKISGNGSA